MADAWYLPRQQPPSPALPNGPPYSPATPRSPETPAHDTGKSAAHVDFGASNHGRYFQPPLFMAGYACTSYAPRAWMTGQAAFMESPSTLFLSSLWLKDR